MDKTEFLQAIQHYDSLMHSHILHCNPQKPEIMFKKGDWLNGKEMNELIYGKGWRSTTTRFLPQNYYCSCCQHEAYKDGYTNDYVWFDWCPYCGTDMRD